MNTSSAYCSANIDAIFLGEESMSVRLHGVTWPCAALISLLAVAPASQSQTTAATAGIAAGLGLTAATGKTTLGPGAGAIEGSLLSTSAFNKAGSVIAGLTNGKVSSLSKDDCKTRVLIKANIELANCKKPNFILVLTYDQQVQFVMATTMKLQMEQLTEALESFRPTCFPPRSGPPTGHGGQFGIQGFSNQISAAAPGGPATPAGPAAPKFAFTDITAALATDTAIAPVTLGLTERMLLNAVLMNANAPEVDPQADWTSPTSPSKWAYTISYVVPSELTMAPEGDLFEKYKALTKKANEFRQCPASNPPPPPDNETAIKTAAGRAAPAKAQVQVIDDFVKAINTPADKTTATPLMLALVMAPFIDKNPLILRLAMEQVGGTTINRSNIWYTLGLPNPATVSAGLVVSFRLVDPATGAIPIAGFVRCAVDPTAFSAVRGIVGAKSGNDTSCAYIAGPMG